MLALNEFLETLDDDLNEKIITKVNSKGEKRKRKQCRPGFKLVGDKCVAITGSEKKNKKLAAKKTARTKKQMGSGYQNKVNKKATKAKKKRSMMGL